MYFISKKSCERYEKKERSGCFMKMDFAKAKEANVILRGKVKYCRRTEGTEPDCIIVDCNENPVFIEKDECVNFPFAKTLISLIGEEVSFTVKDYEPKTDVCFGSMKRAYEIKKATIVEKLKAGEVLDGIIIYQSVHGAVISINGIYGFMRNHNFSTDGTAIREVYNKHDQIKVKLLKFKDNSEILLQPEKPFVGEASIIDFSNISIGNVYKGRVTGSYIDRIYVNIAPECDVLCNVPTYVDTIKTEEFVLVKIRTKKVDGNGRKRLKGYIIDRAEC